MECHVLGTQILIIVQVSVVVSKVLLYERIFRQSPLEEYHDNTFTLYYSLPKTLALGPQA